MKGATLFTDEFFTQLSAEIPDYTYIRQHVIRAYNSETGNCIEESVSSTDERLLDVVDWLHRLESSAIPGAHFFIKKPVLIRAFSPTLVDKADSLAQYNCPLCKGGFPVLGRMIFRISPVSYQAADSRTKSAFKKAISRTFEEYENTDFPPFFRDKSLCVNIVFMNGNERNPKDVDNMAKLFLDSLQSKLFTNDSQIDHLRLIKFRWQGSEEYITVNVRETTLNRHDDVLLHDITRVVFMGERLHLEDFME